MYETNEEINAYPEQNKEQSLAATVAPPDPDNKALSLLLSEAAAAAVVIFVINIEIVVQLNAHLTVYLIDDCNLKISAF